MFDQQVKSIRALIAFVAVSTFGLSGCVSIDQTQKPYEPNPAKDWDRLGTTQKPRYTYEPRGNRASEAKNNPNLIQIGTTQVPQRDGSTKTVTIYTDVSPNRP